MEVKKKININILIFSDKTYFTILMNEEKISKRVFGKLNIIYILSTKKFIIIKKTYMKIIKNLKKFKFFNLF